MLVAGCSMLDKELHIYFAGENHQFVAGSFSTEFDPVSGDQHPVSFHCLHHNILKLDINFKISAYEDVWLGACLADWSKLSGETARFLPGYRFHRRLFYPGDRNGLGQGRRIRGNL